MERWAAGQLDEAALNAARAAARVMGMNNVYYRFLHLVADEEYGRLPARLRMNVIGNPGIDRTDFELLSLAVSAVNGCGTCVASHERKVREGGLSREAVQSAVRIAAVVHGAAVALEYAQQSGQAGPRPLSPGRAAGRTRARRPQPCPGPVDAGQRATLPGVSLYTGWMTARTPRLSAGVVVVRETSDGWRFLLLRAFNHWDFPKGMVEPARSRAPPRSARSRRSR